MKKSDRIVLVLALAAAGVTAFASYSSAVGGGGGGGPKLCPDIYAPVICDNGKTYPNQCYADKAKAKNCVPTGDI